MHKKCKRAKKGANFMQIQTLAPPWDDHFSAGKDLETSSFHWGKKSIMQNFSSCNIMVHAGWVQMEAPPPSRRRLRWRSARSAAVSLSRGGGLECPDHFYCKKKLQKKHLKKTQQWHAKGKCGANGANLRIGRLISSCTNGATARKASWSQKNDGCNVKLRGFWSNPLGLPCAITLCNHPVKIGWPKYAKKNSMCAHSPKI